MKTSPEGKIHISMLHHEPAISSPLAESSMTSSGHTETQLSSVCVSHDNRGSDSGPVEQRSIDLWTMTLTHTHHSMITWHDVRAGVSWRMKGSSVLYLCLLKAHRKGKNNTIWKTQLHSSISNNSRLFHHENNVSVVHVTRGPCIKTRFDHIYLDHT